MIKPSVLAVLHSAFWLSLAVLARFFPDLMVNLSGKKIPIEAIFAIVLIPLLEILSRRAPAFTQSQLLRNYFGFFRWAGIGFWAVVVCLIVVL